LFSESFVPDVHITEQTESDKKLLETLKPLFFNNRVSDKDQERKRVCDLAVQEHNAQKIDLHTDDGYRISALYFKRPQAKLTIIYVPRGSFTVVAVPKEAYVVFSQIFPEYDILMFDWRGFWDSDGDRKMWLESEFSSKVYKDIQAAVEFIKDQNDNPIVLHGFCFGADMALLATLKAQESGKSIADAIGLCSIFDTPENIVGSVPKNKLSVFKECEAVIDSISGGSWATIAPINIIDLIELPCWFDHWTNDRIPLLEHGIDVFQAKSKGFKMFVQSDIGKHSRIHYKVPDQYRNAYNEFLVNSGLLVDE